jgi:hypothetical protein
LIATLALAGIGCSPKEADHFLEALKRSDYDTAFADLHSEARATTPDAAALRAKVEASGVEFLGFTCNCSNRSFTNIARAGYSTLTRNRPGKTSSTVVVGVRPDSGCSSTLVVELKREEALPDKPWRVRGLLIRKYE